MMASKEIILIREKLDKVAYSEDFDEEELLNCLEKLKKIPITENFLRETRIGITLNNLQKCKSTNNLIRNECKSIIRKWKSEISQTVKITNQKNDPIVPEDNSLLALSSDTQSHSDVSEKTIINPPKNIDEQIIRPRKRSLQNSEVRTQPLDSIREGYKKCIYNALKVGDNHQELDLENLASQIEEEIYKLFSSEISQKYKNSVRSRTSNLKDKRNDYLLAAVLAGEISPAKLASMSHEEMASDEMKSLRKKISDETTFEHFLGESTGTPTDMFQCGRCKKRRCLYTQAQILRSDEPMTTFVVCVECGNRWKFV